MNIFYFKQVLLFFIVTCLFSCSQSQKNQMYPASIKAGTAKVRGKIIDNENRKNKNISVYVTVPHPITGENTQYKTQIDEFGDFTLEVNLETLPSVCGLYSDINPFRNLLIALEEGKETEVEVVYNADNNIEKVDITSDLKLPLNDVIYSFDVMSKMIEYRSGKPREQLYDKDPQYFISYAENVLRERLKIVNSDLYLSDNTKKIITKDFSLFLINAHFLDYRGEMLINYRNINGDKNPDSLQFRKPDKSYYTFLKKIDLNNPLFLYSFYFPEFLQKILQNETLNIPKVEEMSVDEWMKNVKTILSDLVGFESGLFYDILAANAYARQFNDELKPLSDRQKENISNYWKDGEIAKILLRKNEEIIKLAKYKGNTIINQTPKVAKECI